MFKYKLFAKEGESLTLLEKIKKVYGLPVNPKEYNVEVDEVL